MIEIRVTKTDGKPSIELDVDYIPVTITAQDVSYHISRISSTGVPSIGILRVSRSELVRAEKIARAILGKPKRT